MSKMIQLRSVPETLHRTLKARAAKEGLSLSDFLIREITHVANRPPLEDTLARIKARPPVKGSIDVVALVRKERSRS